MENPYLTFGFSRTSLVMTSTVAFFIQSLPTAFSVLLMNGVSFLPTNSYLLHTSRTEPNEPR